MRKIVEQITHSISEVVLDKKTEIQLVICCLFSGGHLLIEDQPGVGKTTLVHCLSKVLNLSFSRIQFTSDLLPADILGNSIFDSQKQNFKFHPGPIFASLVLGDELNRANPRTQSALLQALEEKSVSIDGTQHQLPSPFLFIGTQNPKTQIGTFPLPESQLDRFLMSLKLDIVSKSTEMKLIQGQDPRKKIEALLFLADKNEILNFQQQICEVHVSEKLAAYIGRILDATRLPQFPGHALSIRAGMALAQSCRGWAWMNERAFVIPEDVKFLAPYILGHRLFPDQGIMVGQEMLKEILNEITVVEI